MINPIEKRLDRLLVLAVVVVNNDKVGLREERLEGIGACCTSRRVVDEDQTKWRIPDQQLPIIPKAMPHMLELLHPFGTRLYREERAISTLAILVKEWRREVAYADLKHRAS